MTVAVPCLAGDAPELADLQTAREAYRQCAMSATTASPGASPRQAARAAVDHCSGERLALTGRFALDHPGSQEVERFDRSARDALVEEMTGWLSDRQAMAGGRGR